MTDQAEKSPQFIVVRETKTEQADAQADTTQGTTQGNPFADAARETLRLELEKMMAEALAWHEVPDIWDRFASGLPLEPPHYAIKSPPASANQISCGSRFPGDTFQKLNERDCRIASSSSSARTSSQTKRARKCPSASFLWSARDARRPSSTPPSRCASIAGSRGGRGNWCRRRRNRMPESQARQTNHLLSVL